MHTTNLLVFFVLVPSRTWLAGGPEVDVVRMSRDVGTMSADLFDETSGGISLVCPSQKLSGPTSSPFSSMKIFWVTGIKFDLILKTVQEKKRIWDLGRGRGKTRSEVSGWECSGK